MGSHLHGPLHQENEGVNPIGLTPFTPLESPAIYSGDDMDKISTPYRKGGVKAPSFL
jgi:hypothetical protein